MKRCTKCGEFKAVSEFGNHSRTYDGLRCWCKKCHYEANRLYRLTHTRRRKVSPRKRCELPNPETIEQRERQRKQELLGNRRRRDDERYRRDPGKFKAKKAIARLLRRGEILPAAEYRCGCCGKEARDFHHPSYMPSDFVNVIPLCRSCHVKLHHSDNPHVIYGGVVLPVGVVRIATSLG